VTTITKIDSTKNEFFVLHFVNKNELFIKSKFYQKIELLVKIEIVKFFEKNVDDLIIFGKILFLIISKFVKNDVKNEHFSQKINIFLNNIKYLSKIKTLSKNQNFAKK